MAEDVGEDSLDVVALRAAKGKRRAADRLGVDDLEEEGTALLFARHGRPAADCGERAADKSGDDLVDQRQPVALVVAEGEEGHGGVGIGRRLA